MGTSIYKGGTVKYHSLSDNLDKLTSNYAYSNGYFGDKGQGRTFTRNISSDSPEKMAPTDDFIEEWEDCEGYIPKIKRESIVLE